MVVKELQNNWVKVVWSLFIAIVISSTYVYAAPAQITVMIYYIGSDLETLSATGSGNLFEIVAAGGGNNDVNVIVETGGTKQWHYKEYVAEFLKENPQYADETVFHNVPEISNQRVQIWQATSEGYHIVDDSMGEVSMSESATLRDFIIKTQLKFPAEKYVLVLSDHGGAIEGFGYDENFPGKLLQLTDMATAIATAEKINGQKIQIVGYDACLMACWELAAQLAGKTEYLVGSEELAVGSGWDFTTLVERLKNNPTMSSKEIATAIVEPASNKVISGGIANSVTWSVIDVNVSDKVQQAWDDFMAEENAQLSDVEHFVHTAQARSRAESFGTSPARPSFDMVDIYDYANLQLEHHPKTAKAVLDAVLMAVPLNLQSGREAHGLSIYFPYYNKNDMATRINEYRGLYGEKYADFMENWRKKLDDFQLRLTFRNAPQLQNGNFTIDMDKQELDWINEADAVVAIPLTDEFTGWVAFCSLDSDASVDMDNGKLFVPNNSNVTLVNDHFTYYYLVNKDGDRREYTVPIKLYGRDAQINVVYDKQTPQGMITGVCFGYDAVSGLADGTLLKLEPSDEITMQIYAYNPETKEGQFIDGDTFKYGQGLSLTTTKLSAGLYKFGFYVEDIFGNNNFSDFSDFVIN